MQVVQRRLGDWNLLLSLSQGNGFGYCIGMIDNMLVGLINRQAGATHMPTGRMAVDSVVICCVNGASKVIVGTGEGAGQVA
jgi:hypothetical protein